LLFCQLVAGPIVRFTHFQPQLATRQTSASKTVEGLYLFAIGMAKKVIVADNVALVADHVFQISGPGFELAWCGVVAYTLQIYFDFSGYSDMAIGLGHMFGFTFPENFRYPYVASSVQDFWKRWHISLSSWFRDYLYIPLGGGRRSAARVYLNLTIVFFLCGLWHGASWTFIVWGAFHGVLLAINHAWRGWRGGRAPARGPRFAGWLATFIAWVIGLVIFRSADIGAAAHMLKSMAGLGNAPYAEEIKVAWDLWGIRVGYVPEEFVRTWLGGYWSVIGTLLTAGALAVALLVPDTLELVGYREGETHSGWRRDVGILGWRPSAAWLVVLVLLFGAVFANLLQFTEFLYYQF
jgi:alginate O-acetyltransferase complex protein AlgI